MQDSFTSVCGALPLCQRLPQARGSRVLYEPAPEQEGKPQQQAASRRGGGGGEGRPRDLSLPCADLEKGAGKGGNCVFVTQPVSDHRMITGYAEPWCVIFS